MRLVDVKLGCSAALVLGLRDRERFLLPNNVLAGDFNLGLQRADADIGSGDVAQQSGQHIIVIGDRGQIGRIGRFDDAAELAPKINFPIDGETERVAPKGSSDT